MADPELIPTIVQGGSFAALVYIIYWATQKMIPVLEKIQETMLSMQQGYFAKLEEREHVFQEALKELRANCEDCRALWRLLVENGAHPKP